MVIFYLFHLHALLETVKERTFCFSSPSRIPMIGGRKGRIKQDQEKREWRRKKLKEGQKGKSGERK